MELHIVLEGGKDLAGQLYRQLRDAIRSGRLAAGEQVPPSRLLSAQLAVSRKTVAEAYARLTFDKLLTGQVGVGTFVADALQPAPPRASARELAGAAVLRRWHDIPTPLRHPEPEGLSRFEFIGGYASKAPFPQVEWRRCVTGALRQGTAGRGRYGQTEGLFELRQAVAQFAGFTRGLRCSANEVLITNGAQQAIDLVARVLVEPGCIVAVEDPGYPPARLLFESQGARVVGVPVDDEGIIVDQIPEGTRLIYVTPAHQFPLGMPMSLARRLALLAAAERLGAIIIEDDYDSAFRYESRPLDCLQSLDKNGLVAYIGTFSKVMLPEVRIGYLMAPPAIHRAVVTARHLSDWHTPLLMQQALANFIESGTLARHIRRCHAAYATRRTKILKRLSGDLAPWLEPIAASAGFHVTARLRRQVDLALLGRLARRVDVGLYTIDVFFHEAAPFQALFFGFGAIDSVDIDTALDRVHQILVELDAPPDARLDPPIS